MGDSNFAPVKNRNCKIKRLNFIYIDISIINCKKKSNFGMTFL